MKKVISHFIKYPVAANVIVLAMVVLGTAGMLSLKSSFFPLNESRLISIRVVYPGASPREMEEGVVLKIEDNLRGLVGIDRFTSISSENSAVIMVEVLKGYDVDVVLQDVKNAVDMVPSYPVGMEPPVISKEIFMTEAVSMAVHGEDISLKSLKQFARQIENDLRAIDGISQVEVSGFPDEEIEIAVDENKLRAYDLTFRDVANAVSNTNILVTGGSIKTETEEFLIRVRNRSYYGIELDYIVVKSDESGNKIRLRDVAKITDKWSENPNRTYFNGQPSVRISVSTTNSEDLISAAGSTKEYIADFNANHSNVRIDVTRDSSITILQRTELLLKNGSQGILLVLILLALFLKPRLAFWVAIGIPFSFFGMFIFAHMFDVTINVLSLFGMIIVVGILVDDGIVIAENIYSHYEKGKNPIRAAIDGTLEVVPPITSAIITTLVAFSTFFFLEGRVGEFFGQVSVIVILTLSISLLEALIILPSHVAHSKALSKEQKTYVFNKYADNFIRWMTNKVYGPYLEFFLKNKFLGFAVPITLLLLTLGSMSGGIIRFTFFPPIASDRIVVTLKMPQGTNEQITDSLITRIENAAWLVNKDFKDVQEGDKPVIQNIIRTIGPGTSNASLRINLLPGEERNVESYVVAAAIQKKTGPLYGVESVEFGSGSHFGGKPVSIALLGNNIDELKQATEILKDVLRKNPLLKDVMDNDPEGIKEIEIKLKDNAYPLGFTLGEVINQVRSAFFGFQVQRFQRGRDEIKVWVRYDREARSSIKNLDNMRLVSPSGQRVPFSEIATYTIGRGEISINHLDGRREIQVDADLIDPKTSATEILTDIKENVMPEIQSRFPTVSASFEGQNREANKVTKSARSVVVIIIFLIFIIIAFTFRSFSQPLMLMLMVPFSLIGVAWGHWLHNFPINVLSYLGIIALVGIVVNDGLVLIGKFNGFLRDGLKFDKALLEAGKSRFRAIFLTSVTTIAGLMPLMFEKSRQAQFLKPMALSIAYGIALATVLTLVMLPLMLSLGNKMKVYFHWWKTGRKPSKEEVERSIIELKSEQNDIG